MAAAAASTSSNDADLTLGCSKLKSKSKCCPCNGKKARCVCCKLKRACFSCLPMKSSCCANSNPSSSWPLATSISESDSCPLTYTSHLAPCQPQVKYNVAAIDTANRFITLPASKSRFTTRCIASWPYHFLPVSWSARPPWQQIFDQWWDRAQHHQQSWFYPAKVVCCCWLQENDCPYNVESSYDWSFERGLSRWNSCCLAKGTQSVYLQSLFQPCRFLQMGIPSTEVFCTASRSWGAFHIWLLDSAQCYLSRNG